MKQLLTAVDFIHSKNIVHRDLKVGFLSNILQQKPQSIGFVAHLSHLLMVSYCDHWMSVVCRASSTIATKDISSQITGWILTKLGRNDPHMALFKNCSNGSGPIHILVT